MRARSIVVVAAAAVVALGASCLGDTATSRGMETRGLDPDELPPTADAAAVAKVVLCKSTLADVKHVLGEPYRDGFAHGLKVRTWKIKPGKRKAEPAAIAFNADDVVVDLCYDIPGAARCDFADRCAGAPAPAKGATP